jgi:ABC-type multidrug transport system fused ATPase/permease subunit
VAALVGQCVLFAALTYAGLAMSDSPQPQPQLPQPTAAMREPLLPAASRHESLAEEEEEEEVEEIRLSVKEPSSPVVSPRAAGAQGAHAQRTTVLAWHDVTFAVRDWRGGVKTILRGVSGLAGGGDVGGGGGGGVGALCAVLGPSGAGKSSLLDILAGRVGLSERGGGAGELTVAGRRITATQLQVSPSCSGV